MMVNKKLSRATLLVVFISTVAQAGPVPYTSWVSIVPVVEAAMRKGTVIPPSLGNHYLSQVITRDRQNLTFQQADLIIERLRSRIQALSNDPNSPELVRLKKLNQELNRGRLQYMFDSNSPITAPSGTYEFINTLRVPVMSLHVMGEEASASAGSAGRTASEAQGTGVTASPSVKLNNASKKVDSVQEILGNGENSSAGLAGKK